MHRLVFIMLLMILAGSPDIALAHGVRVTYETTNLIHIKAAYDTGEPFKAGQVSVFAPDNPSVPWVTGKTDEKGSYSFTPDPAKPGNWDVRVRSAGHGEIIHIPVGTTQTSVGDNGYTTIQIITMLACVTWGFIGTALFFSRRKG